jgi:hypothetical protein
LLTGKRPFGGQSELEIFDNIQKREPVRPGKLRPGLDSNLETIVLTCLNKDPARRYPSVKTLADDLKKWRVGEPIWARPESRIRKIWRFFVRNRVAFLVVAMFGLGVGVPVALYLSKPEAQVKPNDPDQPLKAIQKKLAKGETVTLIGEKGPPEWFRWPINQGGLPKPLDGTFTVSALELALVELVQNPQGPYRLFAEVQHCEDTGGDVGISFGWSRHVGQGGTYQCFCTLRFNDFGPVKYDPPTKKFYCGAELTVWRRAGPSNRIYRPLPWSAFYDRPVRKPGKPLPWREVGIEVKPETVRVRWGTKWSDPIPHADLVKNFKELKKSKGVDDAPWLNPQFLPTEAVGLYVNRTEASFRRVVIEPIP